MKRSSGPESLDVGRQRFPRPGERTVVVDTESAQKLRDLASYARDFELAAGYVRRYLAGDIEGDREFASPLDAMWMSAILLYARAFSKGVRVTPGPDLSELSSEELDLHNYILDVRNKYLAHSVNGFEHVDAVAFLNVAPQTPLAITGVGHVHTSLSRMERKSVERFLALCERHTRDLHRRLSKVHLKVAEELVSLGVAAVYALPDQSTPHIDQSSPRTRRR